MVDAFLKLIFDLKISRTKKFALVVFFLNGCALAIITIVVGGLYHQPGKNISTYFSFALLAFVLSVIVIYLGMTLTIRLSAPLLKSVADSEKKYRNFINLANDAIIILDAETLGILEVNHKLTEWLKMPGEVLLQKRVSDLHPPESWPTYNQAIKVFLQEQKLPRENVILFKDAEGQVIPAEVNASIISLHDKKVVLAIFRDLRDRQISQEKLIQREQLLSMIISHIPYYVFWKDTNSVFQGCNQNFAQLLGYKNPQDIVGKDDFQMSVKKEEAEYYRTIDREVMQTKREIIDFEETLRDASGDDRFLLTSKVPLKRPSGEVIGILGIFKDITVQKRNENQLRILSQAVEQSASSIVITDIQGTIQYVNSRFIETTGYSSHELIGQNPRLLKSGHQKPAFYENLWVTILSGRQWRGLFKNKKKNGDLYWELATISPIRDEHGKIMAFVGVKDDITHDKELHQILSRMQDQLLQNEKLAAIGQLSSGFAHEIKNPLAIVMLSSDELSSLPEAKNPVMEHHLQLIRDAAQRADRVVRQLLEYSRSKAGQWEEINLKMVIQSAMDLVRAGSKIKSIEMKLHSEMENPLAYGDFVALQEVFMNLITNAVDAIAEQGLIEIRIYLDPDTYHKEQKRVLIDVWDNGSGIPPEQLSKVFEPFFTTKESGQGTGLGLNTVYNIVNKHQGSVWVNSTLGIGTTFTIALPLLNSA